MVVGVMECYLLFLNCVVWCGVWLSSVVILCCVWFCVYCFSIWLLVSINLMIVVVSVLLSMIVRLIVSYVSMLMLVCCFVVVIVSDIVNVSKIGIVFSSYVNCVSEGVLNVVYMFFVVSVMVVRISNVRLID